MTTFTIPCKFIQFSVLLYSSQKEQFHLDELVNERKTTKLNEKLRQGHEYIGMTTSLCTNNKMSEKLPQGQKYIGIVLLVS